MAGSRKSRDAAGRAAADTAQAIRDSAQRIWLAGLGAFEHARSEGPRVFNALVAQGRTLGTRAAGAADEALRSILELNENLRGLAAGRKAASGRKRKARPVSGARKAGAKRKASGARKAKARGAKKRKAGGARRKARA